MEGLVDAPKPAAIVTFPPTPESPEGYGMMNGDAEAMGAPPAQILFNEAMGPLSPDENTPLDGTIPHEQLLGMLKTQLEYYFSR
jgi:hypothetical protein